MDGTEANVSVSGPGANTIAENLLSAAGIQTGHVGEADIEVAVVDSEGNSTVLTVGCGGPNTGELLRESLGNIDWSEYNVESVSAEVAHNDDATADEGDTDGGDDDGDDGDDDSDVANQITPYVESVNPEAVEYPATQPGRIRAGTLQHLVAELLLDARDILDIEWVSANKLSDFAGDDVKLRQAQNQLSKLFVQKGFVVRRKDKDSGTKAYEYNPSRELAQEVHRIGDHDEAAEE